MTTVIEHYKKKINKKYVHMYGIEVFKNIKNDFAKEKELLKVSLDNGFFKLRDLFNNLYFGNKYNSLLLSTGRGTGKTTLAIKYALYHIVFKETDCLCFKEFENTTVAMQQSFSDIIYLLGIQDLFEIRRTEIRCKLNKNRIIFKGVRDVKSSFEASMSVKNKIKVFTNIGLLILDEGNTVSYGVLDALIPTLRNNTDEQVKIVVLFNPYSKESPVESYFKNRDTCLVSKNEFSIKDLPEEYRDISLWTEYNEDKKALDSGDLNKNIFNQRWYGIPNDVENGLVYSSLEEYKDISSLEQHKTIFAIDPAFGGGDTCSLAIVTQIGSNQFVFTGFSWQESIETCIYEIEHILRSLNVREGFIEGNNLSQEWLSNHLVNYNLTVKKPKLNKNYRITQSLYTYMGYYNLALDYQLPNYKKTIKTNLFFNNLFNYVLNSNKKDNEADALTYGIYYLKGLEI